MTNPLVSVIIPTYNRAQYICEAVDSVLAQTYENIEVIVVDDGSTDNTEEILRQYDSTIKYVFQNNAGPSAARNNGIRLSSGDVIGFLDSDDIWLPEKLEYQLQLMYQSDNIGLVSCGLYEIDSSGNMIGRPYIRKSYGREELLRRLRVKNVVGGGSGLIIRVECFEKVGLWNEALTHAEDWELSLRIAKQYDIKFVERPLIKFRVHSGNTSKRVEKMKEGMKVVIDLHIKGQFPLLSRKAYSYLHLAAAMEYLETNKRAALLDTIRSIWVYPFKSYPKDNKYGVLCKCILPSWILKALRKSSILSAAK